MRQAETVVAFDIGNTRTKCAVLGSDPPRLEFQALTRPVDSLADRLEAAREQAGLGLPDSARCIASSVCPEANAALRAFWQNAGTGRVEFFGTDLSVPLTQETKQPQKTGQDRLLGALAARELVGSPCIVVAAGTAITVDLVDPVGRFAGGAIAPGFRLCARALARETACLPEVAPPDSAEPIGRDTLSAIQSGVLHFCQGGVRTLVREFTARMDGVVPVIVTGGDAELLLAAADDLPAQHVENLIFQGMKAALKQQ